MRKTCISTGTRTRVPGTPFQCSDHQATKTPNEETCSSHPSTRGQSSGTDEYPPRHEDHGTSTILLMRKTCISTVTRTRVPGTPFQCSDHQATKKPNEETCSSHPSTRGQSSGTDEYPPRHEDHGTSTILLMRKTCISTGTRTRVPGSLLVRFRIPRSPS